jgi:pimeloyl-ACP methyl ester carboxylesterase
LRERPDIARALTGAAVAMCRAGTESVLTDALAVVDHWDFRVEDVRVPTVSWQGADDTNVPRHIGERYGRTIPGAVLTVVEHEGHFITARNCAGVISPTSGPSDSTGGSRRTRPSRRGSTSKRNARAPSAR